VNDSSLHVGDDLTALLDGALPPDHRAAVESHLAACDACRARRDRLARTLAALSALPPPPEPRPGFEQRFYARLARERPARKGLAGWLGTRPWRWAVPATGLAAAAVVAFAVVEQRQDRLEMARHLDLLEDYVVVASLDSGVDSAEDVEVVAHLDELTGGRP
jgi:anti-sigma factor RsiW